jgi:hypothetical protein
MKKWLKNNYGRTNTTKAVIKENNDTLKVENSLNGYG